MNPRGEIAEFSKGDAQAVNDLNMSVERTVQK